MTLYFVYQINNTVVQRPLTSLKPPTLQSSNCPIESLTYYMCNSTATPLYLHTLCMYSSVFVDILQLQNHMLAQVIPAYM